MNRLLCAPVLAVFAGISALCSVALSDEPAPQGDRQAELAKLEGRWEGYTVAGAGERPDQGPVHLRLTITPTRISAVNLGEGNKDMGNGSYNLNLAKTPKEMDATGVVLPGKRERTYQGIYELNGDTLKWCVTPRQGERPTEFRSSKGSYLLILKRQE